MLSSFFNSYVSSSCLVLTLLMASHAMAVRYDKEGNLLAEESDCKENGSRLIPRPSSPSRESERSNAPYSSGAAAAAAGAPAEDPEGLSAVPLIWEAVPGIQNVIARGPEGITVVTDKNGRTHQLRSQNFPVQGGQIIRIPFHITVEKGGRISFGLLGYGEERILGEGNHNGFYEGRVPHESRETSLIFRNYPLGGSGHSTFTIKKAHLELLDQPMAVARAAPRQIEGVPPLPLAAPQVSTLPSQANPKNDQDDEKAPVVPHLAFSKEWDALQHSPFRRLPTPLLERIIIRCRPHTTNLPLVCQKFSLAFKSEGHWGAFISNAGLKPRYDELRVLNPGLTAFRFCSIACPNEWVAQKAFLEYQLERDQQNGKAIVQLVTIRDDQNNAVIQKVEAEFLLQKFKVHLEGSWEGLLLSEHTRVSPEMLAQARLYRARMLCWKWTQNVDPQLFERLAQVSQDKTLPEWMRAAANFYRGALRALNQIDDNINIEDGEAFRLLTEASENEVLPQWMRDEANFHRGVMCVQSRINTIDYGEAFRLLTETSANEALPQWMRAAANLYRGALRALNQIDDNINIEDGEAFRLLTEASENEVLPQWMRDEANFHRGALRAINRIDDINIEDGEAFRLLSEASENEVLPQWMRDEARFFRAQMWLQHRTDKIDDFEAVRLFTKASENEDLPEWRRIEAKFYITRMWLLQRTDKISDADAFKLLTEISQYAEIDQERLDEVNCLRAKMVVEGRTKAMTVAEAFALLTDLSKNQGAMRWAASGLLEKLRAGE